MNKPHVFHTLDILRGVAALAVMVFHYGKRGLLGAEFLPHGYLAVDFFFILSGFVLSFAYQQRLDAGWPLRSFLLVRVIRLYPLYFAGMAIGFLFSFLQNHFGHAHISGITTVLTITTGLLMVPAFGVELQPHEAIVYPYDQPAWSLFFEFLANIFHASLVRQRSVRFLIVILAVTGTCLIYSCMRLGSMDFGVYRKDIGFGLIRVLFSYTVGLLLYRIWQSGKTKARVPPGWITGLLLFTFWLPIPAHFVAAYDLSVTMLCFPLLVLAGASSQPGPVFKRNLEWMGVASYAVYVIHMPITNFVLETVRRVSRREPVVFSPWIGILCIVIPIAVALLLDRFYDAPTRSHLRKALMKPKKTTKACITN